MTITTQSATERIVSAANNTVWGEELLNSAINVVALGMTEPEHDAWFQAASAASMLSERHTESAAFGRVYSMVEYGIVGYDRMMSLRQAWLDARVDGEQFDID